MVYHVPDNIVKVVDKLSDKLKTTPETIINTVLEVALEQYNRMPNLAITMLKRRMSNGTAGKNPG